MSRLVRSAFPLKAPGHTVVEVVVAAAITLVAAGAILQVSLSQASRVLEVEARFSTIHRPSAGAPSGAAEAGVSLAYTWGAPQVVGVTDGATAGVLQITTSPLPPDQPVELGVWAGGWLCAEVPADLSGTTTVALGDVDSPGPPAAGDVPMVVRARVRGGAWGVPWRVTDGGDGMGGVPDLADGDASGSTGQVGSMVVHLPAAGATAVEVIGTGGSVSTVQGSTPVVLALPAEQLGHVTVGSSSQRCVDPGGRRVDVYY